MDTSKEQALMLAIDRVNKRMGQRTLYYASAGIKRVWRGKALRCSPPYTTSWKHLPVANAV